MDTKGIEQMLSVLRSTAAQASGKPPEASAGGVAPTDFSEALKSSIDKVNQTQQSANQMAEKMVAGDSSQNLHEVMIALQTASVSFQEMVQVRNKLVTAYQDMMNMQV